MSYDDLDDPEAILADEMSDFAPDIGYVGQEPLGSLVIDWRHLTDDEARTAWIDLRAWVEWFTVRYDVPLSTVPTCWWRHGMLVEELSALLAAHTAAFDATDVGFGPIGWHERLTIAMPRLSRAYPGGCSNEHNSLRPRSWSGVTDEQEWDAWTVQAHAH